MKRTCFAAENLLEAWYWRLHSFMPTNPNWDEMLMMDPPPPALRISAMACRAPRNTPLALMSITRSQSATVVSSM